MELNGRIEIIIAIAVYILSSLYHPQAFQILLEQNMVQVQ